MELEANFVTERMNPLLQERNWTCLLYKYPSPRDAHESRMPSSA